MASRGVNKVIIPIGDRVDAVSRVIRNSRRCDSGCWEWRLKIRPNGYARVTFKQQSWYAHRLAYAAMVGPIAQGMDICHHCDNRKCVNPDHLFEGSRKDNMQDAVRKGRQARGLKLPHAKLSEADKEIILNRAKDGELYKVIAKDFGVTRHAVGYVALNAGVRRHG